MRTLGVSLRNQVASPAQGPRLGGDGATFEAHLAPRAISTNVAPEGAAPVSSMGLPLLIEDVDDRAGRRRKAVQRGAGMLALLDLLREGSLGDEPVPTDLLDRMAACLGEGQWSENDDLRAVLQEIETRVQVELARRGR